ncbi:unnamed protein product [Rhizoctonia solani]|uniref:Uncharacterized protein n=1 Tax=Rhizoctonia solani TaxID=456999 RepID=A0A8H3C8R6_9AGAM|nr:unnamed protein product [Rhizoctonia solani]
MGDIDLVDSDTQYTASLSRAAESLAKAAVKLSEAAMAMSLVARALTQGGAISLVDENRSGDALDFSSAGHASPSDAHHDDGAGLPQPYRLLLEDESDILLFLCSLIYDRPKVVCYITCSFHTLKLYKYLIDSVTETSAVIPGSPTKTAIDICYGKFLKDRRSIALFSETDIPSVPSKDVSDYTVIHVGWSIDKRQYVAQRRIHHASTNILLAYSGDKEIYPSVSEIMSQTVAWPGDTGGFRVSVDILRPLCRERLSELSFEAKEEAYLAIPVEFVAQYGLQQAVQEGLLRPESDAADYGHIIGPHSANGFSTEDTRTRDRPEAPPLGRHDHSPLESARDATRSILSSEGKIVQGLYNTCITTLRGRYGQSRSTRSPKEVMYLANRYAARTLLHGTQEDGSRVFPPIAGIPSLNPYTAPPGFKP